MADLDMAPALVGRGSVLRTPPHARGAGRPRKRIAPQTQAAPGQKEIYRMRIDGENGVLKEAPSTPDNDAIIAQAWDECADALDPSDVLLVVMTDDGPKRIVIRDTSRCPMPPNTRDISPARDVVKEDPLADTPSGAPATKAKSEPRSGAATTGGSKARRNKARQRQEKQDRLRTEKQEKRQAKASEIDSALNKTVKSISRFVNRNSTVQRRLSDPAPADSDGGPVAGPERGKGKTGGGGPAESSHALEHKLLLDCESRMQRKLHPSRSPGSLRVDDSHQGNKDDDAFVESMRRDMSTLARARPPKTKEEEDDDDGSGGNNADKKKKKKKRTGNRDTDDTAESTEERLRESHRESSLVLMTMLNDTIKKRLHNEHIVPAPEPKPEPEPEHGDDAYAIMTTDHIILARGCPMLTVLLTTLAKHAQPPAGYASVMVTVLVPPDDDTQSHTHWEPDVCLVFDMCFPSSMRDIVEAESVRLNHNVRFRNHNSIQSMVPSGTQTYYDAKEIDAPYRCARIAESVTVVESHIDFGVYKRPGFDHSLALVRALPGMAALEPIDVARRGMAQTGPDVKHPRQRYNSSLVDVIPKSEAGDRNGLLATHRGKHKCRAPDGRWTRMNICIKERDATQDNGERILSTIAGLLRVAPRYRGPGTKVPPVQEVDWTPLVDP